MVDVVRAENGAGELLEEVGLFVGDAVRADDTDGFAAAGVAAFAELLADVVERDLPANGLELAVRLANQRLGDAGLVVGKVEGVAALVAEKVPVHAALVAVVTAYNLAAISGGAHAESGLASIGAVGAGCADVLHLPWPGLVTISA